MEINIDELKLYDCANAKTGDKVIYAYMSSWGIDWSFTPYTIKSVSPKRGDITLDDRFKSKFDKYGHLAGRGRYDTSQSLLLEYSENNLKKINPYIGYKKLFFKIKEQLEKLRNNCYAEVREMPEDKLKELYELIKE